METVDTEIMRGNTCTMAPGDAAPFGADWCAVMLTDRVVLYVTHRDGTQVTRVYTHPIEIATLTDIITSIRPPAEPAVGDPARVAG